MKPHQLLGILTLEGVFCNAVATALISIFDHRYSRSQEPIWSSQHQGLTGDRASDSNLWSLAQIYNMD